MFPAVVEHRLAARFCGGRFPLEIERRRHGRRDRLLGQAAAFALEGRWLRPAALDRGAFPLGRSPGLRLPACDRLGLRGATSRGPRRAAPRGGLSRGFFRASATRRPLTGGGGPLPGCLADGAASGLFLRLRFRRPSGFPFGHHGGPFLDSLRIKSLHSNAYRNISGRSFLAADAEIRRRLCVLTTLTSSGEPRRSAGLSGARRRSGLPKS